jgi:hypothetical protein
LGVLTCEVQGGKNYLIEESKTVRCNFTPNLGIPEHYTGTISKLGIDIGSTGKGAIAWDVIGGAIPPGGLEGAYGKVPSRDRDAIGPLLGGFENSVALNPIIEAGDNRFGKFVSGVGDLSLKPSAN